MLNMRIKIDVYTQGLQEDIREGVREKLRELFCQLPPRRIWFYLKQVRYMLLRDRSTGPKDKNATALEDGLIMDGPEDSIARGSISFPRSQYYSHLLADSTTKQ